MPAAQSLDNLQVGQRLEARRFKTWHPVTIQRVLPGGYYLVCWDDGINTVVPKDHLRLPATDQ